jgi:hypothetical protein
VGQTGDVTEKVIEQTFPGRIDPARLSVTLESGAFDDFGEVIAPNGAVIPVSERGTACAALNPVVITDLTPFITVTYDAGTDQTKVAFRLRATDACNGYVGWSNLKVRYTARQ